MRYTPERISWPISDDAGISEVIDVRAPAEFKDDHIPGAVNLPVFDDAQRAEVGTIFKQDSPFLARRRGAAIICKNISRHFENHFNNMPADYSPLVYCWRGGQRSASLATILTAVGWRTRVLEGGYKMYRRAVIDGIESRCPDLNFHVLNGLTGSGKTRLLERIEAHGGQVLDLEQLASHKGSVLGTDPGATQPSQKFFESLLWKAIATLDPERPIFAEAESRKVGNVHIPTPLWERLTTSPIAEIRTPLESRVVYLLEDYPHWPDAPDRLIERLEILRERHGHERIDRWISMIRECEWHDLVRTLLEEHYDPSYSKSTNYPPPDRSIDLPAVTPDELDKAASVLLG